MSPVTMHNDEVQYYASPIQVKEQQYFATLTSERLIIEGATSREFPLSSLLAAYPEPLKDHEPGVKVLIASPSGQKEMIWSFPVPAQFREGEQEAWISNIMKVVGDNPLAVQKEKAEETRPEITKNIIIETEPEKPKPSEEITIIEQPSPKKEEPVQVTPDLIPGETITLSTAGVRVKHTFFTIYLTNLRLILQNNSGKIGREFAISDLKDAAELESDAGEPEIALSVGMQSGLRQMILSFPTKPARDAWMSEFVARLPASRPQPKQEAAAPERVGTFTPATNERTLVTTPNVRIKNRLSVIHLTNTRFVVDSASGIVGEFALNTLNRAVRMASEIGEPGISLKIGSPQGVKEMHIVFSSVNDREAWMDAFTEVIPDRAVPAVPESREYTVTTVTPQKSGHSQQISCPSCRAMNYAADEYCSFCGAPLHPAPVDEMPQRREQRARKEKPVRERPERVRREKAPYNGSIFGFITRPSDAFSYYCRDGVREALPVWLLSGVIWAVVTVLFLAFIIPVLLKLDRATFPIITSLQSDPLLLVILALILFAMWAVCVFLHAGITAVFARLFDPGVSMGEAVGVVMRSSMTYAAVGWIPIFGMFAAGIWGSVCAWKGLENSQDMQSGVAAVAAFAGCVVVYAVLLVIGGI